MKNEEREMNKMKKNVCELFVYVYLSLENQEILNKKKF